MKKSINVVIGLLINAKNEILIAERPAHVPHGGLWEFPGGKIESEEKDYDALCRELSEEIGVQVSKAEKILEYPHQYPSHEVILSVWKVMDYEGVPQNIESQQIRWVSLKELPDYQFPQGNYPILKYLEERAP